MLDSYIILNRQPKIIIKIFYCVSILLTFLSLYLLTTLTYTSYYSNNSYVTFIDKNYYLKLKVQVDKLNLITTNHQIILDNNIYNYQVYKIENDITNNSQIVYLKIANLDESYKINNYGIKIKIEENTQKIIQYIKNKKEE